MGDLHGCCWDTSALIRDPNWARNRSLNIDLWRPVWWPIEGNHPFLTYEANAIRGAIMAAYEAGSRSLSMDDLDAIRAIVREELASRMLTQAEAAEYLHVTEDTLRAWARDGRLRRIKTGMRVRYRMSDLDAVRGEEAS